MDDPNISSEALRTDLIKEFGVDEGTRIYQSLMSCTDRLTYAQIRLRDLRQVIEEQVVPHFEAWQATYFVNEPEGAFNQSQWKIRMLATEAVQHLHGVFDPLACAIYWFNVPATERNLPHREVTFYKVRNCAAVSLSYRELMTVLSSADSFFHLAALSNSAKHSRIVRSSFCHERDGKTSICAEEAILFESCEGLNPLNTDRKQTALYRFPETSIPIYLEQEIQRVIPIFNALVGHIRSDLTQRRKKPQP
jgi:hypothetical protein